MFARNRKSSQICLILVLALLVSIISGCTGQTTTPGSTTTTKSTTTQTTSATTTAEKKLSFPLEEKITIEFVIAEHPTQGKYSWASDGHPGFIWLEEQTNIKISTTHIPVSNVKDKMNLMLQTNDLPDLMQTGDSGWTLSDIEKAGEKGLFVNVLDDQYRELIPRYLALIDATPQLKGYVYNDSLYGFYQVDPNAAPFVSYLVYRKDLWDQYNLKNDTWDELYESLKILKQNNPASYPFGFFSQGSSVTALMYGPVSFRSGTSIYFNHDKNDWVYGPTEDNYKMFIEYYTKLYSEGLINPDFSNMTYEAWSESWIKSQTVLGFWWSASGNWFSPNSTSKNPNYGRDKEWTEALRVPSMTAGGPRGWLSSHAPTNVYAPKVISGKSKYIPQIMMLMDFVCDVENVVTMSYGEKGAYWDIIDGKYRWVAPEIKTPYNPTGTMSYTDYFKNKFPNVYMGEANMSVVNDSQASYDMGDAFADPDYKQFLEEAAMYVKDGSTQTKPQPITRFNAADSEEQAQLKTILDTYASELTIKMIMGQLPISEFDNMKAKLKELGSDKLVEMYRKAAE